MPEGDRYVTNGALLRCDKGVVPTPLTVLPRPSRVNGQFQATVLDCLPAVNIKPFGVCAITHAPCVPVMPFWTQAHTGALRVGGAPPLLESSVCQCGLGGRISVLVLSPLGPPQPLGPTSPAALAVAQDQLAQQAADTAALHARERPFQQASAGLKEAAGVTALVALGCAVGGLFFPPLLVVAAVAAELSEVMLVGAVVLDVAVLGADPSLDNWVTVGADVVGIGVGYAVGKVLVGPALGALARRFGPAAGEAVAAETAAETVPAALSAEEIAAAEAAAAKAAASEAKTAAEALDKDGGHSYADHGAQTTAAQQAHRLKTGEAPSGRIPVNKKGQIQTPKEASKFSSNEKHLEAAQKAEAELADRVKNGTLSPSGGEKVVVDVKDAGPTYRLDASNNPVSSTADKATAIYRLDPITGKYKLVTLYPSTK